MPSRSASLIETLARARRTRSAAVVAVCNVTPDSFSDGGDFATFDAARAHVDRIIAEGADFVEIGGESTRPGAHAVAADEQIARIGEAVSYAAKRIGVIIDTHDPRVARDVLERGAWAVNDVSCLRNEELADVVAAFSAGFVLMHARGTQFDLRGFGDTGPFEYGDVVGDVIDEWNEAKERALRRGVEPSAIVMDPGLGFAKNAGHSVALLDGLRTIVASVGAPVMIGASRKSFLRTFEPAQDEALTTPSSPKDRRGASIAVACEAVMLGASLVRVHDVRDTVQALAVTRHFHPSPPLADATGVSRA